ncbi:MAG: DNA polymerase III subunit delta [Nitrospinae bacterium]|nr:DNA polymerase III subunit delta [Nitrospinota bacterium]MZH06007.1 DNA polymerase III subunit delta [Nitrospinota bacterium]MZH14359.1 DNA polymerase III subunit delta [Nitrospinota bacterium]
MTPEDLDRKISQGKTEPFYFLYGPETFYHVEAIQSLSKKWINEDNRDFNLEAFEAKTSNVNDWLGSVKTLSFLGGTKLVIVRNLHDAVPKDEAAEALIDYCSNPVMEACLVITADKVDRKRKIFKALTKLKGAVACEAPKEHALISWVQDRAKNLGYAMNMNAARALVYRVGNRPGVLAQELNKTLMYVGKNKQVSENDVQEVVGETRLENVFSLTDALKNKNPQKALQLLHNQLDHGEEPIKIMGTIAWQFRVIWEVKHYQKKNIPPGQIAKAMGANPFVVEKALQHTKNFSNRQLQSAYKQLTKADRSLKSTSQDPVAVMQTLVLALACN